MVTFNSSKECKVPLSKNSLCKCFIGGHSGPSSSHKNVCDVVMSLGKGGGGGSGGGGNVPGLHCTAAVPVCPGHSRPDTQ